MTWAKTSARNVVRLTLQEKSRLHPRPSAAGDGGYGRSNLPWLPFNSELAEEPPIRQHKIKLHATKRSHIRGSIFLGVGSHVLYDITNFSLHRLYLFLCRRPSVVHKAHLRRKLTYSETAQHRPCQQQNSKVFCLTPPPSTRNISTSNSFFTLEIFSLLHSQKPTRRTLHRGNGFFTDNLPFLRNPRRAKRPKIELTRPFTTGMNAWAATFLLRITQ